jgi:integrase
MPRIPRGYWLEQRKPGGAWYVAWTEDRRKHARSTGTRDKGEAQAWLERFLAALAQPEQPEAPTVAQILVAYLADREGKVVDHARLDLCARHLTNRLGWLHADALRPSHSRTYAAAREGDGVAPGTIRKELITLRSALRWALAERWIDAVPGVPAPPKPRPRERWLTREEAAALQAAAVSPHVRLFIEIALGTASRSGAIRALLWSQVDLDAAVIDFGRGTGNKRRAVVPISATLCASLAEAAALAETPFVIEYHRQRVGSITKAFARAVTKAGIEHCTPHDLRRTAGSWMLQAGVPIEVVSSMLGHRDIRTTREIYTHWNVEFLRGAADVLAGEACDVATHLTRNRAETA